MRRVLQSFCIGLLLLGGCATAGLFPWPYYGAHITDRKITLADVGKSLADLAYSEGVLYGRQKDPGDGNGTWADAPLADCQPDPIPSPSPSASPQELKCITEKVQVFYDIKNAYEQCITALGACQHPQPPPQ